LADDKRNLTQLCISLNASPGSHWASRLRSASPAANLFSKPGERRQCRFTFCRIEDNSFIEETYQIPFNFGTVNKLGFNVGADFTLALTSNICATLDMRAFFGPKYRVPSNRGQLAALVVSRRDQGGYATG